MKTICVIGPECTGKTDLSSFLAGHYQTAWVPEFARHYIDNLVRPYRQADLEIIARGQIRMEDEWTRNANGLLVCDTNLLVIKIWSEHTFGSCANSILTLHSQRKYDLYLLTDIDIPWEDDPQREHPDKRDYFFNLYKQELIQSKVPYITISGTRKMRYKKAIESIQ